MSVNPHYNGFLSTSGQWSLAILAKHVLVATLIAVSAVHTWDVLPSLRRALMRKDKLEAGELERLCSDASKGCCVPVWSWPR